MGGGDPWDNFNANNPKAYGGRDFGLVADGCEGGGELRPV